MTQARPANERTIKDCNPEILNLRILANPGIWVLQKLAKLYFLCIKLYK